MYNVNPFTRRLIQKKTGVSVIQMLNSTSLLALVPSGQSGSSPRKLMLWNSQTAEIICELPFPSTILGVRLNRNHLIVALDSNIHIFDLSTMNNTHTLSAPSNHGLIDLTHNILEDDKKSILAFKGLQGGDLVLFDCWSLRVIGHIKAHKKAISASAFNSDASLCATASATGTVVRVFSIPSGQHLMTFRRGTTTTTINSLSFSPCSTYLSAGSSSGTVHIFALDDVMGDDEKGQKSVFAISNILPVPAQEFAESQRAIVVVKMPGLELDTGFIASLLVGQGLKEDKLERLKLIVCTRNGYLYRFSICESVKPAKDFSYTLEDELNVISDFVDPSIR